MPDYDKLNSKRLKSFQQLDFRIDKKFFFNKWALNIYFDAQNVYKYQTQQTPILLLDRDANGNAQTDPSNPAAYKTKLIENPTGNLLETLGIIIEF